MGYHHLFCCDFCYSRATPGSPIYRKEGYPDTCNCEFHDLCYDCMNDQQEKLDDHKTTFWCPACERLAEQLESGEKVD